MQHVLDVAGIKYPVLCFSDPYLYVQCSPEEATTCTKSALNGGFFGNVLLVDSRGLGYKIKGARKLHGVGVLWGYNIFLNQRIRVELVQDGEPFEVSVDDVRQRVMKSFKRRHGWTTRDDFEELQQNVENARSIAEIIQLLRPEERDESAEAP